MNRLLYLFFICLAYTPAQAQCQLCQLSETDAKKIVQYLSNDAEIVLYCNYTPGSKDFGRHVKIKKVYYQKLDASNVYEIKLEGTVIGTFDVVGRKLENYVKNDMPLRNDDPIDITYVHIRAGGFMTEDGRQSWEAISLGIYLGYDCDPGNDPFQYPNQIID